MSSNWILGPNDGLLRNTYLFSWKHLKYPSGPSGNLLDPSEPLGNLFDPSGPLGNFLDPPGPLGKLLNLWGPLRACRFLRDLLWSSVTLEDLLKKNRMTLWHKIEFSILFIGVFFKKLTCFLEKKLLESRLLYFRHSTTVVLYLPPLGKQSKPQPGSTVGKLVAVLSRIVMLNVFVQFFNYYKVASLSFSRLPLSLSYHNRKGLVLFKTKMTLLNTSCFFSEITTTFYLC